MNLPATLNFKNDNPDAIFIFGGLIDVVKIWPNTGQVKGLPKNPRYILDKGVEDLDNSLREDPEYLIAHPLVLFPYADAYVAIEGNMRRESCVNLGIKQVPALVLNPKTPIKKLIAYMIKGNVGYGKWDYDILANEFELPDLAHYGLELPEVIVSDDTEKDETIKDPDAQITIVFKGNLDKFDIIKERIESLIMDYPMISIK